MKATLSFNLPEEKNEYILANKASEMYDALWEISQYMRKIDKYGTDDDFPTNKEEIISKIRYEITELIGDALNGVE